MGACKESAIGAMQSVADDSSSCLGSPCHVNEDTFVAIVSALDIIIKYLILFTR